MTSRKPKAEARGVWIIEFKHSLGWTPFELLADRSDGRESLAAWRQKAPRHQYRVRRYIPAKTPRPAKRKR